MRDGGQMFEEMTFLGQLVGEEGAGEVIFEIIFKSDLVNPVL